MFLTALSKKRIINTSLLNGMTDIHTHLLPGVDDGASNEAESIEILKYMESIGVKQICFTPHIMDDLKSNLPEVLNEKFLGFKEKCNVKIKLSLAAEYMLDQGFLNQLENGLLSFNENHVLIETSYMAPPPDFIQMIFEIIINGYTPVLAHPERYMYMQEKDYEFLKEKGCKFQLNLFSLSGYYGKRVQLNARNLLKQNKYDFTGSDVHHLNGYEKGLQDCLLSNSQIQEIKKILSNNELLC